MLKKNQFHVEGLHRASKEIGKIITQVEYKGYFTWYGKKAKLLDVRSDGVKIIIIGEWLVNAN